MWLYGGLSAAADTAPTGVSDQLIIVVGGVITAAIVALSGVLVAIVNSKSKSVPTLAPPPTSVDEHLLYERTAVLARRADDSDERDEVQDRRLDQIERVLDIDNPNWRKR